MDREALKELIRSEPGLAATFVEIDAEFTAVESHYNALKLRRDELRLQLDRIADAKSHIAQTGDPALSSPPEAKPTDEE